jgi:hypothetical protein
VSPDGLQNVIFMKYFFGHLSAIYHGNVILAERHRRCLGTARRDCFVTSFIVMALCLMRFFIFLPENPRLLSLGMNGTRNGASEAGEVEVNPA